MEDKFNVYLNSNEPVLPWRLSQKEAFKLVKELFYQGEVEVTIVNATKYYISEEV